jgi:type IV fimbrial biogenesis protein FimT
MNTQPRCTHSLSGFTLIETITTLAIACMLLAVAVPSFKLIIQNNRMSTARSSISAYLNLARNEAVTRNTSVVVCPSSDGLGCKDTTIWDEGIIIFTDNNKSGQMDTGEELIRYINMSSGSILIHTTINRKKAKYDAQGFSMGNNVTFTFCDSNNQIDPKAVIVSNSGRERLSDTKYDGSPLDCY